MGDTQGNRGAWIDGRSRDREVDHSSPERDGWWRHVGCLGSVDALARRALRVRCVACTTAMVGFVVGLFWG